MKRKNTIIEKMVALALALVLVLSVAGCGAGGKSETEVPKAETPSESEDTGSDFTYEFKLTTPLGDSHTAVAAWNELFEELSEQTDGRLTGVVYTNNQLSSGNSGTSVDMVQSGAIDIGVFGSPLLNGYVPEMDLPVIPFMFDDFAAGDAAMNDPDVMAYYTEKCDASNFYFFGWMENSWNEITNNVRELALPDDLKGIKMRVTNDLISAAFTAAGATTANITLSELYTSLQQGVVDGQENGISGAITANKLYEVQDYLTYCQYSYNPFAVVMNSDTWNKLPAEDQELMNTLFAKYAAIQIQNNRDSMEENLKIVEDYGVQVHVMTEEERAQWKAIMGPEAPAVQEVLKKYDQEFLNTLLKAAGSHS